MSNTDRQVDLVQEGFDCVLRLGPIGDETLIARPLGQLRLLMADRTRSIPVICHELGDMPPSTLYHYLHADGSLKR